MYSQSTLDLIDFASDAAFVIDRNAKIVAWNSPAETLLGHTAPEVKGHSCDAVLQATLPGGEPLCHPDCDPFRCLSDHHPCGIGECKVQHRDGQWLDAGLSSIIISDPMRAVYGENLVAIILIRDHCPAVPSSDNNPLQIFTLGGFRLASKEHSIDTSGWKRKQAVTLLKYLATQLDRQVHFERLIDTLWPDADEIQGRERLKVTMYALRRELRANGIDGNSIKTVGNAYSLRRDAVWIDSIAFERFVHEGQTLLEQGRLQEALTCYARAERLYRGDFMEEETYTDWCAEERERLRELYLEMLSDTAECFARMGKYAEAIETCRKALVQEPCRENLHYALMVYLASSGAPGLALNQYRHCEQVLAQEFGTSPTPRIYELYQQICDDMEAVPVTVLANRHA